MSLFIPVKKWDFRKVTIYPAQCFWIVDNLFLPKIGHFVRFSYWKSLASWGLIISSQKNPNLSSIKNLHERISYSGSCGDPPESKTSTRESRAKTLRKECVKFEPRKQRRKQVDIIVETHLNIHVHHHSRAIFRVLRNTCRRENQNRARKNGESRARERTAKRSRQFIRIGTKSLPDFWRRSVDSLSKPKQSKAIGLCISQVGFLMQSKYHSI